ncbi:uncharacterized protein [Rutidosis leptorrhynchoides]|uniref:uncharacterized protein n=1 Tax=Rutidosis leptorrhynchoides TaxID=125765 RepID=UPI003A9A57A6
MADQNKQQISQPVNHITLSVPIKLEVETSQYNSWAELFKIHCRAHDLIEHLNSDKPVQSAGSSKDTPITPELWNRQDVIVLQWIYATISKDLLNTILETDTIAKKAWDHLKSIFHDNQHSRAIALEHQFTNIKLDNFPNVFAYCQEVKMLADQMTNVGLTVTEQRMVLQMVAGLGDNYETIGTYISQSDPLPKFYEARSRLILEESRKNRNSHTAASTSDSAVHTTTGTRDNRDSLRSNDKENSCGNYQGTRGRGGRSGGRGGRFNSRGRGRNSNPNPYFSYAGPRQPWTSPSPWAW